MLRINKRFVQKIYKARTHKDLHALMQNAIELEHATIPPYLTAMFSMKRGMNREIWDIIHSVVIEEMLHMTIACNILNALGGKPAINKKEFVPSYPGPLPMGIGGDMGLIVGLEKYSKKQVKKVFMEIEEPEDPLNFPKDGSAAMLIASEEEDFNTIGEFYQAVQKKISELPGEKLPGDVSLQVVNSFYPKSELFPIITKSDAINAIDIIIEQGEGTSLSPVDPEGELAHYYRFSELYEGRQLVKDSSVKEGYSYTGAKIPFDPKGVQPIYPNTKVVDLPDGPEKTQLIIFNQTYRKLLNGLHKTFNGAPDFFPNTLGLMFDLKLYAEKLCALPFPGKPGYNIGPSFEFVDVEIESVVFA